MSSPKLYDMARLPPQAIDLEELVLGALMLMPHNETCLRLMPIIQPEHFYKEGHQYIASALISFHKDGIRPDLILLVHHLKKIGKLESVGGAFALSTIQSKSNTSENIEHHYRILIQLWMLRELLQLSQSIRESAYEYDADPFVIIDSVSATIQKLNPYSPDTE